MERLASIQRSCDYRTLVGEQGNERTWNSCFINDHEAGKNRMAIFRHGETRSI